MYFSQICVEPMADNLYPENTINETSLKKKTLQNPVFGYFGMLHFCGKNILFKKKVILLMNVIETQSSTC